jgi:hypothetical protein
MKQTLQSSVDPVRSLVSTSPALSTRGCGGGGATASASGIHSTTDTAHNPTWGQEASIDTRAGLAP